MAKAKRNVGKEILSGLKELRRGERGRITAMPDVAKIRESTGLSQARFAQLLGVSPRTLQTGSKGGAHLPVQRVRCCWSRRKIQGADVGRLILRVVTLEDKVTVHNAFPDRRFRP